MVNAERPVTVPATTFDRLRYSANFQSALRPDGTLRVSAVLTPRRTSVAVVDGKAVWTDDPSRDAQATKMIPDLEAFAAANPDVAVAIGTAWAALDAAVAAINAKLKLV